MLQVFEELERKFEERRKERPQENPVQAYNEVCKELGIADEQAKRLRESFSHNRQLKIIGRWKERKPRDYKELQLPLHDRNDYDDTPGAA